MVVGAFLAAIFVDLQTGILALVMGSLMVLAPFGALPRVPWTSGSLYAVLLLVGCIFGWIWMIVLGALGCLVKWFFAPGQIERRKRAACEREQLRQERIRANVWVEAQGEVRLREQSERESKQAEERERDLARNAEVNALDHKILSIDREINTITAAMNDLSRLASGDDQAARLFHELKSQELQLQKTRADLCHARSNLKK